MRLGYVVLLLSILGGISAAQETNFPVGPQYLVTTGTPMFLRPIATPSLSLDAPLPNIPSLPEVGPEVSDTAYAPNSVLQNQPDLFPIYYGYPTVPIIELVATDSTRKVPDSISGVGIALTDAQTLREFGYGVTVGEAASFWKSHKLQANHAYTNSDIKRLHQS